MYSCLLIFDGVPITFGLSSAEAYNNFINFARCLENSDRFSVHNFTQAGYENVKIVGEESEFWIQKHVGLAGQPSADGDGGEAEANEP